MISYLGSKQRYAPEESRQISSNRSHEFHPQVMQQKHRPSQKPESTKRQHKKQL
jgi:hypothetical protein